MSQLDTLNVGCGEDEWGDIRLDIKRQFSPTIVADAHNLPFRKNSFKIAKASHILEHLSNPNEAMNELLNVTTEKLIIAFPTEKDVVPCIISSFISLNWRMVSFYFKYRKLGWHKWVIKHEAVTKFLEQHGWRCTTKKGRKHVFNILRSKRLPHRIQSLIKFSPKVTHEYVIEGEKEAIDY